jgi:hypothetical protein
MSSAPILPGWDPPPRPVRPRRAPVAVTLVVALLATAVGLTAWWSVGSDREGGSMRAWHPQIAPLARFVERERGLTFEHVVVVRFLDGEAWAAELRSDESLTDDDRHGVAQSTALLRALGLADRDTDLVGEGDELAESHVLAYYDPAEEEIVVRGDGATPDVFTRGTIVHELTHALQDQHFDLDALFEGAYEPNALGVRALVEGDATRVEHAWVEQLPAAEQDEYWETLDALVAEATGAVEDVVPYLRIDGSAPYDLGVPFVDVVSATSLGALDDAFGDPPRTDEHVWDPLSYVHGDEAEEVEPPRPPPGVEPFDEGFVGVLAWYVLLSERIDPHTAFRALTGWGGDAYVAYEHEGVVCVRSHLMGEDARDTEQLYAALLAWAGAMPDAVTTLEQRDGMVAVESCDPGAQAAARVTGRSVDAMALPVAHASVVAALVTDGVPARAARCVADGVVAGATLDQLADPDHEVWVDATFGQRLAELTAECSVPAA